MSEDEMSLTWVIVAVAILVALLGWGFMAGSYVGAQSRMLKDALEESGVEIEEESPSGSRRRRFDVRRSLAQSVMLFLYHTFTQIPNFFAIVSWHFSNRIWLPIAIGVVEFGVICGGFGMKKLESNLSQSSHKRYKRKKKRRRRPAG